jgi:hypothetical protein
MRCGMSGGYQRVMGMNDDGVVNVVGILFMFMCR